MTSTQARFSRLDQVLLRVPLCKSQIYGLIAKGAFPRPYRLSARSVGWLEADIDRWIEERIQREPIPFQTKTAAAAVPRRRSARQAKTA